MKTEIIYKFTEEQLAALLQEAISQFDRKAQTARRSKAMQWAIDNTFDNLDRDRRDVERGFRPVELAKQIID